jgi:formylglycine-generating enzyme required for sulfatase activity
MKMLLASVWAVGMGGVVCAQGVPTPGAPSQPFTAAAQAQNGGAGPQVTYQYGMEFVTINAAGNAAYPGGSPNDTPGLSPGVGRGAVDHDFRIGRYEVGSDSWAAFYDAANAVQQQTGQAIPFISQQGGLSGSGQYGRVGNISWRTAAIYCNWLCNGQAVTRDAFMNGAYDVSTFGYIGNQFTDQLTHNPGAQFWIPTLDEWMAAAHYDPNHNDPQFGHWWQYSIARDTHPNPGLPGHQAVFPFTGPAEANTGFSTPDLAELNVLLGAYSNIQSPWGLFDTAGEGSEWTEEPFSNISPDTPPTDRMYAGSHLNGGNGSPFLSIGGVGGVSFPSDSAYWMGFRIAAAIPEPGTSAMLLATAMGIARRKRM